MVIWLRGLERWYLVLGGVAVGRGFEPQSDLEPFFAEILLIYITCRIFCAKDITVFQISCELLHFEMLVLENLEKSDL
jgi:hypothetical protein